MADVAVKTFEFRIAAVHVPNATAERRPFFRWLELFLDASRRTVLVGDWNTILDPNIDRARRGASGLARCDSGLSDFLTEFDLVDRYRLDHPGKEMWTWIGNSSSGQVRSYRIIIIIINSTHLYKPKVTWLPPWKS